MYGGHDCQAQLDPKALKIGLWPESPIAPQKELARTQVRDWLPRHTFPDLDDPIPNLLSPQAKVQLMEYGLYYPWAIEAVGFAEEAGVLLL